MRLLNEDTEASFSRLTLLLTRAEASELRDSLESILQTGAGHQHIPSEDDKKEITVAIYDDSDIGRFNERSQRLIREDQ